MLEVEAVDVAEVVVPEAVVPGVDAPDAEVVDVVPVEVPVVVEPVPGETADSVVLEPGEYVFPVEEVAKCDGPWYSAFGEVVCVDDLEATCAEPNGVAELTGVCDLLQPEVDSVVEVPDQVYPGEGTLVPCEGECVGTGGDPEETSVPEGIFTEDGWLVVPPPPLPEVCAAAPTWWECYLLEAPIDEAPAGALPAPVLAPATTSTAQPGATPTDELAVTGGGEVVGLVLLGVVALAAGVGLVWRGRRAVKS